MAAIRDAIRRPVRVPSAPAWTSRLPSAPRSASSSRRIPSFTVEELGDRLPDVPFESALDALTGDGLIERRGELIGASHAGVRAAQLAC